MKKYLKISFLIIFATLISCKPTQEVQDDKTVIYNLKPSLRTAFPNLTFANPIEITHAGDQRLFVVEQVGRIRVFTNDSLADKAEIFLDIASRINSGGEKGLLGLAFHPDFSRNGFFFVNYTRGNLETVVARYKVSASNPNQADANSEAILLTFTQPYSNHNGGKLAFGPDGMLYVSSGDGGSGGDPQNNSQNRENLLGKILRIDVNGKDKGNYSIPSDNPYKNNTQRFREEIWAYGLRNPWRMSFDRKTGELWAGDVGQNKREEIDIIVKGGNYGWRLKEGKICFNPDNNCERADLIDPIWDYVYDAGDRSVTGGYVYRGKKYATLVGKYVYGDYAGGRIWTITYENKVATNQLLFERVGSISAFGEDKDGEIYICNHNSGKILTF